jgi:hypothetical protein
MKQKRKPLKWYYHKIMCEIGWLIRSKDSYEMYHRHLNGCVKQGFNLYGRPWS